MNGVPSISILDGWWDEGFNGRNGWAIGGRETVDDEAAQDEADAERALSAAGGRGRAALLRARRRGLPGDWLATMRAAIEAAIWQFSTARMLGEYVEDSTARRRDPPRSGEPAPASV